MAAWHTDDKVPFVCFDKAFKKCGQGLSAYSDVILGEDSEGANIQRGQHKQLRNTHFPKRRGANDEAARVA